MRRGMTSVSQYFARTGLVTHTVGLLGTEGTMIRTSRVSSGFGGFGDSGARFCGVLGISAGILIAVFMSNSRFGLKGDVYLQMFVVINIYNKAAYNVVNPLPTDRIATSCFRAILEEQ